MQMTKEEAQETAREIMEGPYIGDLSEETQRHFGSTECEPIDTAANNYHSIREWSECRLQRADAIKSGERINKQDIFVRDNWTCGICGEPILKGARWPHPYAPTIDHIMPIARGGTHTKDNVQCAHWGCNRSKHAVWAAALC